MLNICCTHCVCDKRRDYSLTKEECDRLESFVESGLDVLALTTSEDAAEPATQEVQETHPADGSSSTRSLEVEDGNRETFMILL